MATRPTFTARDMRSIKGKVQEIITNELTGAINVIVGAVNAALGFEINPWLAAHWNLTQQGRIFKLSPKLAEYWAREAGHATAKGARKQAASDYRPWRSSAIGNERGVITI